ncbi:MAG TPA: hypothetical protein VHS97_18905 [Isosphaeraceae bacterium]|jgi:hypothetical protein|nr:hypothetical protein [Isosphaeraceae bacterium]
MRPILFAVVLVASLVLAASPSFAQNRPRLHDIDGFMTKGVFTELDSALMTHRLSLEEIEKAHFNGQPVDLQDILAWMAKCEKLKFRVEEPLEVRGTISVVLPPNTLGDEAYTVCYYAFNFNGLGLAGSGDELLLVRPEKHPRLPRTGRPWNPDRILAIRLFRLGYLKPDPILRQYKEKIATAAGHAILEKKSNVLIVTDSAPVLEALGRFIDSETLEAMGMPSTGGLAPGEEPRPPSIGAIASRQNIHFYLMALARQRQISLAPVRKPGVASKYYPEGDLWTDEQGYQALQDEYTRISEYVRLVRETGADELGAIDFNRTLSPREQKSLAIRFGLAGSAPVESKTQKTKKKATKKR